MSAEEVIDDVSDGKNVFRGAFLEETNYERGELSEECGGSGGGGGGELAREGEIQEPPAKREKRECETVALDNELFDVICRHGQFRKKIGVSLGIFYNAAAIVERALQEDEECVFKFSVSKDGRELLGDRKPQPGEVQPLTKPQRAPAAQETSSK